jgi:hypothetical protein
MTFLRRALWRVYMPIVLWFLRRLGPPPDPWEPLDVRMPLHHYGSGVQCDFPAYLADPSTVSARSLAEIQEWLLGCHYQTDKDQFGRDHWQHASEFESRRVGDCDDHALWAWRKLIELGVDATLVVGWCLPITRPLSRHAWVTFRDESGEYLFETATSSREEMLRPLAEARTHYRPEYGVDRHGRRFTYAGALLSLRAQLGIDPLPPEVVEDEADGSAQIPVNPSNPISDRPLTAR